VANESAGDTQPGNTPLAAVIPVKVNFPITVADDSKYLIEPDAQEKSSSAPLFSIIVVHYQGTVAHEIFARGQESLEAQTFKDFEVLRYHDGPLMDPSIQERWTIQCTAQRHNDWGHSLRDLGIRAAKGEYILHFNADNILYPEALEEIAKEIRRPPRLIDAKGQVLDTNDIIIFPIKMWGLIQFRNVTHQVPGRNSDFFIILSGNPPRVRRIDCMQLVMKRTLWLAEGGWRDKQELSDGVLYEEFAWKYGYRSVGPVLGEHF
jgi:hypothetical protein